MYNRKSPMCISLYHTFGDSINADKVKTVADAMVSSGLVSAGYNCLNIGDAWCKKQRENGQIVADSSKFPEGLLSISEYLAERNIKLGIVTSAGAATANGYPGLLEHEYSDVENFAALGIKHISVDFVKIPPSGHVPTLLRRTSLAIRAIGAEMYYSVFTDYEYIESVIRSMSVDAYAKRTLAVANEVREPTEKQASLSGPYCHFNCGEIVLEGSSFDQTKTALTIAAMYASPITIDCDVTNLDEATLELLKNRDIYEIFSDEEDRSPRCRICGVYEKMMDNRKYAVAFVNSSDESKEFTFYTHSFGLVYNSGYFCRLRDVFTGEVFDFDNCHTAELSAGASKLYSLELVEEVK